MDGELTYRRGRVEEILAVMDKRPLTPREQRYLREYQYELKPQQGRERGR